MQKLIQKSNNISDYLLKSDVIDIDYSDVKNILQSINNPSDSELDIIKRLYEFVRDDIPHSADCRGHVVTCRASDVLKAGEGICYAKSHLLAALLRAVQIPTGFCYQLLRLDQDDSALILHGLNAVYIKCLGRWIRLDARGNKPGVQAEFSIGSEMLAFPVREPLGEIDYPMIYAEPDPNVVNALITCKTLEELWGNLPKALAYK